MTTNCLALCCLNMTFIVVSMNVCICLPKYIYIYISQTYSKQTCLAAKCMKRRAKRQNTEDIQSGAFKTGICFVIRRRTIMTRYMYMENNVYIYNHDYRYMYMENNVYIYNHDYRYMYMENNVHI